MSFPPITTRTFAEIRHGFGPAIGSAKHADLARAAFGAGVIVLLCAVLANIGVEDLARLISALETVAAGHRIGALTCGDIMSRDLVTVQAGARVSQVWDLFRKHAFTSIPVVADNDVLLGVIFQLELIRSARHEGFLLDTGLMNPTAMSAS